MQLIIGFFLTVAGGVAGLFDKWKKKTETGYRRSNRLSIFLLSISLGGGLMTFWAGIDAARTSERNEKIANDRQKRIDSQNLLIYRSELVNQNLIDKNLQYNIRLDSSTNLNYRLASKITNQAQYIEKYISGGESYPHVEMKRVAGQNGRDDSFLFSVENSFALPIYDIAIQAFDYDKISSLTNSAGAANKSTIKLDDYLSCRLFEFNTAVIPPKEHRMSPDQYTQKSGRLFIVIHSRNKRVIKKIALIQRGNNSYGGYLISDDKGNILKEFIYNNPSGDIKLEIKNKLNTIPSELDNNFVR